MFLLKETLALCGTRCVIIDIQAPSFTRVNSLRLQSQCLAITAFCKAPQKNRFHLFFWRPMGGLLKKHLETFNMNSLLKLYNDFKLSVKKIKTQRTKTGYALPILSNRQRLNSLLLVLNSNACKRRIHVLCTCIFH